MFSTPNTRAHRETSSKEAYDTPLTRHEALSLFIRLQRQGYEPYMTEDENGQYRVSHDQC